MTSWIESSLIAIIADLTLRDIILISMTPAFILVFFSEYLFYKKKHLTEKYIDLKESIVNFLLGGNYQLAEILCHFFFLGGFLLWIEQYQLYEITLDNITTFCILFILEEFCYYWYHRCSHRVRWFWCAHVVHHSSQRMNFSTAMRQSITYPLSGNFLFFVPLVLLGFSAQAVFATYAFNLSYQYFIHTQSIDKFHPLIEFIFNTPSHHRAHHGRNPEYIDKNYGGVVIIFDRIFSTFAEEREDVQVDYGITRQIHSTNLLTINFHEWIDMFKDMATERTMINKLKHLIMPPEWRSKN